MVGHKKGTRRWTRVFHGTGLKRVNRNCWWIGEHSTEKFVDNILHKLLMILGINEGNARDIFEEKNNDDNGGILAILRNET